MVSPRRSFRFKLVNSVPLVREKLLNRLNDERSAAGLNPLQLDDLACKVATDHANSSITGNIARSVREGQQKVQYVYRNFPGQTAFGRNATRYMTEVFKEAGVSPRRVVVMYSNDLFGKTQTESFLAAQKAAGPGFDVVEVIPYPENAADLSTEVSRAKAAKPDIIAPVTRPATAILLLEELAKQRVEMMGIISPGAPGLYETRQIQQLKELIEYVMDATVYANYRKPETQKVAAEYAKRSGGRNFDASGSYSYDAIQVMGEPLAVSKSPARCPTAIAGASSTIRTTLSSPRIRIAKASRRSTFSSRPSRHSPPARSTRPPRHTRSSPIT